MTGKCCVAAALLFAGTAAAQTSTTLNVPIVITHGAPLTTFTFVNNSGNTLPAGSPVSFGQAFRYGDVMPGNYPVIRDATTHVALAGQQWDEISTWRENGGNNSWRHAVWAIDLPNSLASGASYQVEFVDTAGAYSKSAALALSALCAGPNAHDLKIHLTDIRNQDDTVRQTGEATFRLCDHIVVTGGRDDPRILDQGSVRTTAKIVGKFVYTDASEDPLLYAECNVGLYVDPTTGNSLKDTSWVCWIHNSWMTVAQGAAGHAGNPGPAGLANDPQTISYRPEMLDGTTSVLNWSALDATVSSLSNPVVSSGCGSVYDTGYQLPVCLNIPTSTGANAWYYGQAVRITSTGTPVGGLTNGNIDWVYPNGSANNNCTQTNLVTIIDQPSPQNGSPIVTGSQGSGSTTFSFRVWHPNMMSWLLMDTTADDNWSPGGTVTRVTREVLPAFTATEKLYWESTGIITPLDFTNINSGDTNWAGLQCQYGDNNYHPMTRGSVIGGQGVGARPDLGFPNSFAAQAFIDGLASDWRTAKIYSTVASTYLYGTLLDEASGRIPVLNNGPPTGPGGNGTWNNNTASPPPYAGLSVPRTTYEQYNPPVDFAYPRQGIVGETTTTADPHAGIWPSISYGSMDHEPNFQGFTYAILGSRHWLDELIFQGNRSYSNLYTGPSIGSRDDNVNNGRSPITSPYHYWGLSIICCQSRGSARALWDKTLPAALGGDNNIERTYFNDIITENWNYYQQWEAWVDGPTSHNFRNSLSTANYVGESRAVEVFIQNYNFAAGYVMQTYLHSPMAAEWMAGYQRWYEGLCGETLANHPPSFYCIDYTVSPSINNTQADVFYNPSVGQYYNGVDGSDYVGNSPWDSAQLGTGGQIFENSGSYMLTNGDGVRLAAQIMDDASQYFDQLEDGQLRPMMNVDRAAGSFYIQCSAADHAAFPTQCPAAGGPFTSFTRGGVLIQNEGNEAFAYRPQYDPGPGGGFADVNYAKYGKMIINGLQVLGYDVSHAQPITDTRMGATPGMGQSAYGYEVLAVVGSDNRRAEMRG